MLCSRYVALCLFFKRLNVLLYVTCKERFRSGYDIQEHMVRITGSSYITEILLKQQGNKEAVDGR